MPKLVVKNFINIREAEIDMNKTLVVFIGETASGKSVLARLLYLFQEIVSSIRQYLRKANTYPPEYLKTPGNEPSAVLRTQTARKFQAYFGDVGGALKSGDESKETPTPETPAVPFEIAYHYTSESVLRLTSTDEQTLHIELPSVMEEIDTFSYDLRDKLAALARELPATGVPAADSEVGKDVDKEADNETEPSTEDDSESDKKADEFQYILCLAGGMNHITEKFSGGHRETPYIPADRNIASNYPDALKRIFYGGIKSEFQTRPPNRSRANLHLIARFLEKNEEFLDTFNSRNFQNLFDERIQEEADESAVPFMTFLLEQVSYILHGEYKKLDENLSQSRLFSHPTGENQPFLVNASTGHQSVIRILQDAFIVVLYHEVTFRVIEEPEACLHPKAQEHLMYIIAMLRNRFESQIVLTTHSPYLLAILKNLLTAGRRSKRNRAGAAKLAARFPEYCWLMPDDVEVYHLKDGIAEPIVRPKHKTILPNPLSDLLNEF